MRQGGYGAVLEIGPAPSYTAVASVEDVDEFQFSKFIDEATGHGATGGYYEAEATNKRRAQPFNATLLWDSTAHSALITALASDSPQDFRWKDPAVQETLVFSAHVEMIGRLSQQESTYRATITLHPSGVAYILGKLFVTLGWRTRTPAAATLTVS